MGYLRRNRILCDQGAVRAVRYSVDGEYCLTAGSDKTVKLWNPVKAKEGKGALMTYGGGHGNQVLDVCSSCDNNQILSCGADRAVVLWEVGTGKTVRNYRQGHAGAVNCVKFNEDSSLAVSGSVDGTAKCWDLRSRRQEPVQTLGEATDTVATVDISDHEILTGSADCKIRRYDLRNGKMITYLTGLNPVTSARFSADGESILVNLCHGEPVKLFDKSSGELLQEFQGHSHKGDYRIDVCLDEDNTHVAAGSEDGLCYVWNLLSAKITSTMDHEGGTVHSLSHHPEKPLMVTACRAHVFVWEREPNDESQNS